MTASRRAHRSKKQAQSLIELAVFGSVLFFLIGGIAANYFSGALQQNAQFKAMRMAMQSSYSSSFAGSAARNSATFLMYEDRLTGDFAKFGTIDRSPVVAYGSGSLSSQLMQYVAWGEIGNLPMMDLRINGQEFHFRTSNFVHYAYRFKNLSGASGTTVSAFFPADAQAVAFDWKYPTGSIPAAMDGCVNATWQNPLIPAPGALFYNCVPATDFQRQRLAYEFKTGGDFFLYKQVVAKNATFQTGSLTPAWVFDLTRDGDPNNNPPSASAQYFDWQWGRSSLAAVGAETDPAADASASYDSNADLREETIIDVAATTNYNGGGYQAAGYLVAAIDAAAGDVDPGVREANHVDPLYKPGLSSDMRIYGRTACVPTVGGPACTEADITYLDIREGKLFLNGEPVNVSTAKKNQYDVVERVFQLNHGMIDPDGFYENNRSDLGKGGVEVMCPSVPGAATLCSATCMTGDNIKRTCFDRRSKKLYIRSRISNKDGHRWTSLTGQTWSQSLGGF